MALCFLAWGLFHAYLYRRGMDYVQNYLRVLTYFTLVAALLGGIFWSNLQPLFEEFALAPIVALGVFVAVQIAFCLYVPRYGSVPREYLVEYPDRYFLEVGWRRLISKSADIAAQQVFIMLLVVFLRDAGLTFPQLVGSFLFLFALLHLPLIIREKGRWPSWLFAGAVLAFSATFPYLLLYVPYGFVYTYMTHWVFYMTTALVFLIKYNKTHRST